MGGGQLGGGVKSSPRPLTLHGAPMGEPRTIVQNTGLNQLRYK